MIENQTSNANLRIWERVEHTDPDITKDYKGKGGFEGTSLNSIAIVRNATQIFGPVGEGWGYDILEDFITYGAPLIPGTDSVPPVLAAIHTLKVRLWYIDDGKRYEVPHYGHTDFIYKNSYGIQTESEPHKKSLTDALKKCLSMLGFSADVFMGKFDDKNYVEEAINRSRLDKADNKVEEEERQAAEYRDWLTTHAKLLSTASNMNELRKLFTTVIRKLDLRKDEANIINMTKLKDKRMEELADKKREGK